jgi:hypothetical protein
MRHGVAVCAALFVSLPLFANNFRAADTVYVPTAGRVGSFNTDVYLSNPNPQPVTVSVAFAPTNTEDNSGVAAQARQLVTLQPFERREIRDPLAQVFGLQGGLGQLIFFGCSAANPNCDCSSTPNDCRSISVESRIYSTSTDCRNGAVTCTTGQLFSGLPWFSFAGSGSAAGYDSVFIAGIRQFGSRSAPASGYRSNLGFANASMFSSTTLSVELFDALAASRGRATVTLGPLGHAQRNIGELFPDAGELETAGFVVISQASVTPTANAASAGCADGCPGFFAYGSVLDNSSDDATTLEAQFAAALTADQLGCMFSAKAPARPLRRR